MKIKALSLVATMAAVLFGSVLPANAAWYDSPSVLKVVPLAENAAGTIDPHFMNKSEDDSVLLVNLQSSGDNAPTVFIDMADLADRAVAAADVAIARPVAKPSDGYGKQWKGGAVSAKLKTALMGSGLSTEACAIKVAPAGCTWEKGSGLKPLATSNGYITDGLDFAPDSSAVYSSVYEPSAKRGYIAKWTYDEVNDQLVFVKEFATSLTRIRNISVYSVGGKTLVYAGEGTGTSAAGKVIAIDVAGDTWTETVVSSGLSSLTGDITNVKLSNEDTSAPVMYVLCDSGKLGVYTLAANGLSVASTVKTFSKDQLLALSGNTGTTAKFRNFEVTKDGKTAFLINRTDTHNAVLAVLGSSGTGYIESNGSQFINTGYYPNGKTKIEVDFELTSKASNKDCVFGNYGSTFSVLLYANPVNTDFQCCGKDGNWSAAGTGVAIDTARHKMVIDVPAMKGTMYAPDGSVQGQANFNSSWSYNNTANWPIALFASCNSTDGSTVRQPVSAKIYSAKIWESDDNGAYSLIHDYTPAVKDGIAGLFDYVTGDFLFDTRTNGGTFASGGDIATLDDDPCIISGGTAQTGINSGCYWGPNSRIEVDYAFDAITPYQMRIFGADGQTPRIAFYLNGTGNASFGFDKADHSDFSALNTGKTADTRRYIAVADQKAGKAYYILKAGTGVVTNWTGTIPSTPTAAATLPIALFGDIKAAPNGFKSTFHGNNNSAKARIYGAKFYENDVLVRDLVPLVKAGIPGFRDKVSGDFVTVDRDSMLSAFSASPTFSASPSTPSEQDDAYILLSDYTVSTTNYTTYIDTGYTATTETGVELDFAFDSDYPQSGWVGHNDWNLFAAKNGSGDPRFSAYFNNSGFAYCYGASLWQSNESPNLPLLNGDQNVRRTVIFDGHTKKLAFITGGYTNSTATLPSVDAVTFATSLKLGANEGGNSKPPLRVYGFKISEGGVLQHDYIPKIKDGVAGLYDKIGGGFLTSANKNISLKYGGTITGDPARDAAAYLESDGTQGINLDYFMNPTTRLEADFAYTDYSDPNPSGTSHYQQRVFGQDSGGGLLSALYINGAGNFMFGYGNTFINNHGPSVAADTVRHTAVIDSYHDRLYWITGNVTNNTYDISGDAHSNTATWPSGVFATPHNQAATTWRNPSKMKLYSLRIYESDKLVHEFVPYSDNGVACLYDAVTGAIKKDARNGNAFVLGGMGVDGTEKWVKALPAAAYVPVNGSVTLTAAASGAVDYIWKKNGKAVAGASGETLEVLWRNPRYGTDTYTVTPVYIVNGEYVEGEAQSCTVENRPQGLLIIVR